ncbi:hypothetical protein SAY86_025446 [Trapa natans]|uniref:Growth-regulating factor n=1 Tax=Trapa natans TaxID=22666 RepID=A0AAN7M8D2_TRANT|nr:hypothetical protein SAY86_025446 [Trapa natans]
MDLHLKQWRDQQQQQQEKQRQSEATEPKQHSSVFSNAAKIPKLISEPSPYTQPSYTTSPISGATATTLPLFEEQAGEQEAAADTAYPSSRFTNLPSPAFSLSDQHNCRFPRDNSNSINYSNMGSYFSWAQWQELELQALIYRYMMSGAAVPPELLQPIKKSLLHHPSPYFLHPHFPTVQYPPSAALLHSGYWGRAAMDPEPGRCRRTDGKKWRCSRDVVAGQKYCERHMHRGRNRSRKPVENPTPVTATATTCASPSGGIFKGAAGSITAADASSLSAVAGGGVSHFSLSGSSPSSSIDIFNLDQSYSSDRKDRSGEGLFSEQDRASGRTNGHTLRHFFDDWPRSLPESDNVGGTANDPTCLSISDVSLKLSTGNGDEPSRNPGRDDLPMGSAWAAAGWGSNPVASMGGPLAEALRSSSTTAGSSPTSVLHQLPRGLVSEASFISN